MSGRVRLGLKLLNLSAWIRRQPWLLRMRYRRLPRRCRAGVNNALRDGSGAELRFPWASAWSRAGRRVTDELILFMDDDNATLVDYRLVPVSDGEYPHLHEPGDVCAEPDVEAATMCVLVDDLHQRAGFCRRAASPAWQRLLPQSAAEVSDSRLHALAAVQTYSLPFDTGALCPH